MKLQRDPGASDCGQGNMSPLLVQPNQQGTDVRLIGQRPKSGDDSASQSGFTTLAEPGAYLCTKQVAVPLTLINWNSVTEVAKAHPERVCVILQHIGALTAKCVLRNG
jgi:hypothetical protein